MEAARSAPTAPGWISTLTEHARQHPLAALGLGLSLLTVFLLLAQSLLQVASGEASPMLQYALLGGLAGFTTTTLGALPALFLRGIPQKLEDSLLGMAAGMMLAASAFSL